MYIYTCVCVYVCVKKDKKAGEINSEIYSYLLGYSTK